MQIHPPVQCCTVRQMNPECTVQGGMGLLGQAAGRMDLQDFSPGGVTPMPNHPEADYMDPAGSDIELSPG